MRKAQSTPQTKAVEECVTPKRAAEMLGCCVTTIRRGIRAGRIPIIRIGPRTVRIPLSALVTPARATRST